LSLIITAHDNKAAIVVPTGAQVHKNTEQFAHG